MLFHIFYNWKIVINNTIYLNYDSFNLFIVIHLKFCKAKIKAEIGLAVDDLNQF